MIRTVMGLAAGAYPPDGQLATVVDRRRRAQ